MNIQVKDLVGLPAQDIVNLMGSFLQNRKPTEGDFDYGLETHGVFGIVTGIKLQHPIEVKQVNKRLSERSPIHIVISRHYPII